MIILQGLTIDELLEGLSVLIDKKLDEKAKQPRAATWTYLSRKEVAAQLKIWPPTLNDWTREGWLQSYKMGNRVLYKSNEVDQAVLQQKFKKYTPFK